MNGPAINNKLTKPNGSERNEEYNREMYNLAIRENVERDKYLELKAKWDK